jgi:hypothetical protein
MGRGRSVYKQPGTRVDEDRTTQKGGIPSKWEGLGNKGSYQGELSRGVIKGSYQGELSRGCAICLILSTCTYISCYRVNVGIKELCLGYK